LLLFADLRAWSQQQVVALGALSMSLGGISVALSIPLFVLAMRYSRLESVIRGEEKKQSSTAPAKPGATAGGGRDPGST
jgi:hypothetical protein